VSNVFFVGCGPGDPELITVKAKKLIQKADVVVYSGSLIPDPILKLCKKGKIYDAKMQKKTNLLLDYMMVILQYMVQLGNRLII
jgi:precorrin-4 methylase